jgi:oligoxyloglucan reducing-end-specific cellobiohydrolase
VYLYGYAAPANVMAIFRSDDNGASWLRINDDAHQYGGPTLIQADPRVYGRVFLGMNGRGIIYGDLRLSPVRRRR